MIDAHAHLSSESDLDVGPLLDRAYLAGVLAVVCTTPEELERGLTLSNVRDAAIPVTVEKG